MWVVSTFLLIFCNDSKSANSPDFIFLFDWFKRNADWRVQQTVVAREQKYTDWRPSLDNCKMLCFGHVAAYFLWKRFYILDTCVIFHEILFSRSFIHSWRFYFIQGALFFLHSAFLFLHSALFRFLCESALVYFLQLWVSWAISLSFQIVMQLLFQFLGVKRLSLD